jgi:hypothetical protein
MSLLLSAPALQGAPARVTITFWKIKPGQTVQAGDLLAESLYEFGTDGDPDCPPRIRVRWISLEAAVVARILVPKGRSIAPGETAAELTASGAENGSRPFRCQAEPML